MENYLHFDAINEAYAQQSNLVLGLAANFGDFDDVPATIAELVHNASGSPNAWADLEVDVRGKKISKAKRNLNHVAVSLMTKARIDEVDPAKDILGWFEQMKQLIEQH